MKHLDPGGDRASRPTTQVVVIWIDWYAYHIARFRGLLANPALQGRVTGIEMVGGEGVHAGLRFKAELPTELPVITLAPSSSWKSINPWRLSRSLWKKLNVCDSAAVLVPGYYTLPAITAALWAKSHDRLSILMTESTAADHRRAWWKEQIKSLLLRALFDRAVSGGSSHRRYLAQLRFPGELVAGCYDVVDNEGIARLTKNFRSDRTPEDFSLPEMPYFLYVGRLAAEKNVGLLLSAWLAYRREGGTWPLVLVGDGPARAELECLAATEQFGTEITFAGHRRSDELIPFYAFAGCFVLPSTQEPWGLVVNEAMAAHLPVLVSTSCGCAEDLVLQSCNGFHFDPLVSAELQDLMFRMSALSLSARIQMGETSAQRIESYSPQGFGSAIASLLAM